MAERQHKCSRNLGGDGGSTIIIIIYSILILRFFYKNIQKGYRERGLLHISDEAFEYFKILENLRIHQMNLSRLAGSNMKASFADNAVHVIQSDATLSSAWRAAFNDIEPDKEASTSFVNYINLL